MFLSAKSSQILQNFLLREAENTKNIVRAEKPVKIVVENRRKYRSMWKKRGGRVCTPR